MIKVNASLDPVGDPRPGSPWCLALAERGRRRFRAAGRLGAQWQDGGGSWGSHGMKPGPNRTQTQYKGSEVTLYLLPQNLVSEKAQLWQGSNWLHPILEIKFNTVGPFTNQFGRSCGFALGSTCTIHALVQVSGDSPR